MVTAASADTLGVATGVHLRPSTSYDADLHRYNTTMGKNAAILMWFIDWQGHPGRGWGMDPYLIDEKLNNLPASERPVIMLTWLPINGRRATGCDQDYSSFIGYSNILAGKCDDYIRRFATEVSRRPYRFLIRFAHEMNLQDSSYWPGHSGLGADSYIRMFRRVHDVFLEAQKAAGKVNGEFVWSPNYFSSPADSWNYLHNYYPGDAYVDWIGLSGYNWYPGRPEPDRSFKQLYGDLDGSDAYYGSFLPGVLYDLSCRYAKPIILAEFGAAHNASTVAQKVSWINDAYAKIPQHPFVRAVVWFDDFAYANNTQPDFRVSEASNTGPVPDEITNAYRNSIQNNVYRSSLPSVADATPSDTYCWTDAGAAGQPVFTLSPSRPFVGRNSTSNVLLNGLLFRNQPSVSFVGLPSGISAAITSNQLSAPWGDATIRFTIGPNVPIGSYPVTVRVNSDGTVRDIPMSIVVVDRIYKTTMPVIIR